MNSTTSLDFTSLSMTLLISDIDLPFLILRRAGLQSERVQLTTHPALKRLVNHLVLLYPRLAAECCRNNRRGIMIAITGEVANFDFGVGQSLPYQGFNRPRIHGHDRGAYDRMKAGNQPSCTFLSSSKDIDAEAATINDSPVTPPSRKTSIFRAFASAMTPSASPGRQVIT